MSDDLRDLLLTLKADVHGTHLDGAASLRSAGDQRKRRSRVLLGAAVLVVLAVGGVLALQPRLDASVAPTRPILTGDPSASPTPTGTPSPSSLQPTQAPGGGARSSPPLSYAPILVKPGQHVPLAGGGWMWLTSTSKCIHVPGQADKCTSALPADAPPGGVRYQPLSAQMTGIYYGVGASKIWVTGTGVRYLALIVQLRSHPTFQAFIVAGVPTVSAGAGTVNPVVRVYDASGRQLAALN